MLSITLRPAPAEPALEAEWRDLEARADPSFFQSWTWTGCLFAERFSRPVLLRAERDGRLMALGLFQRGRMALHLGESGIAAMDSIYIEHNGLLRARDGAPDLVDLLRAARGGWRPRRLVLSGVDDAHLAAARGTGGRVAMRRTHVTPVLDLARHGTDWLAGLSANTRQQLRRSARAYGRVRLERAETVEQAWSFLDALAELHQRAWQARGERGAFAEPFFRHFHRELIARALPRGEADLLRVSGTDAVIGYLYNFRHRGRVLAYQSGFDYAVTDTAMKPGMTCHHAAIDMYASAGIAAYDFLAGDHRYKRSFANARASLHWLSIYPPWARFLRG